VHPQRPTGRQIHHARQFRVDKVRHDRARRAQRL
jgi:hypothetical protein